MWRDIATSENETLFSPVQNFLFGDDHNAIFCANRSEVLSGSHFYHDASHGNLPDDTSVYDIHHGTPPPPPPATFSQQRSRFKKTKDQPPPPSLPRQRLGTSFDLEIIIMMDKKAGKLGLFL